MVMSRAIKIFLTEAEVALDPRFATKKRQNFVLSKGWKY